jgi:hypothetical protein
MVTGRTSRLAIPDGGFGCFGTICKNKATQYCSFVEGLPPPNTDAVGACAQIPTQCLNNTTCECLKADCPCVEHDGGIFVSLCQE